MLLRSSTFKMDVLEQVNAQAGATVRSICVALQLRTCLRGPERNKVQKTLLNLEAEGLVTRQAIGSPKLKGASDIWRPVKEQTCELGTK